MAPMSDERLPDGWGIDPGDPAGGRHAGAARTYTTTALPSSGARLLAFLAILVSGLCGGLIGWSVSDLQCGGVGDDRGGAVEEADDGCAAWSAGGALVGAVTGAGGVGIVSVLVLRAMGEWRRALEVDELPRTPSAGD